MKKKNVDQDGKVILRNDISSCRDPAEVPRVMHTNFPAIVMILRIINIKDDVIHSNVFQVSLLLSNRRNFREL